MTQSNNQFFALLLLFLLPQLNHAALSSPSTHCDKECQDAIKYDNLIYYSTRSVALSDKCLSPRDAMAFLRIADIDARKFKPKSSWMGAYLLDLQGAALSPIFVGHGNLSFTEYVLVQSADQNRITLNMKHYAADKVDYRFDFNRSGWISYGNRYGCASNAFQVDNTRIIATDYLSYVVIWGCADSEYMSGFHISGYLLLIGSVDILDSVRAKVQPLFKRFAECDDSSYNLPVSINLAEERETLCEGKRLTTLCDKESLAAMAIGKQEVMKDIRQIQRSRLRKKKAEHRNPGEPLLRGIPIESMDFYEEHEVPYEEIACLVTMFASVAMSLYWTHFSF